MDDIADSPHFISLYSNNICSNPKIYVNKYLYTTLRTVDLPDGVGNVGPFDPLKVGFVVIEAYLSEKGAGRGVVHDVQQMKLMLWSRRVGFCQ